LSESRSRCAAPWLVRPPRVVLATLLLLTLSASPLLRAEHSTSVAGREERLGAAVDSLLAVARERNPELAAMRFEAAAVAERVTPAAALADPMLLTELRDFTNEASGGSPTVNPSRVGSTRYQISQSLPWWGKRDNRRAAAEAGVDEAQGRANATWAELAARIKTGYAQYYRLHHSLVLNREVRDLLVRLEQIARVRYAGGLAAQQDAIRAQVELSALEGELAQLEAEVHGEQARLNSLLSRPPEAPLAEPQALRPVPLVDQARHAELEKRLQERNPQLFAEAARVRAAEKGRDVAYDNRKPDFRVGVGAVQMGSRVAEWELMFEMNIPLQQGVRRAQEGEANAMLAAARARQTLAANAALSELAHAVADLQAARKVEQLTRQSLLPQAELTFQAALAGYETGKVDFATLLDAQRQIRQSRLAQLKAQTDAQIRLAEIERAVGEDL